MLARFLSLSVVVVYMSSVCTVCAQYAAHADPRWGWKANDVINAIADDPATNTVYVGGAFTSWMPQTDLSDGAVISRATGLPDIRVKSPNDAVTAVVDDGQGGWFLSGVFAVIGDSSRNGVARIGSDGNATAWHPGLTGSIGVMVRKGDTLIVGGQFTQLAGAARTNLAMVRVSTGQVLPFSTTFTGTSSSVTSLFISGDTLFVAGAFATVAGSGRTNMCAFRISTGALTAFNPNVNGTIRAMTKGGGNLYIGGSFTTVGGLTRTRLASFSMATGALSTTWTPAANGTVDALAWDNGSVLIGGEFTSITGTGDPSAAYMARRGAINGENKAWYLLPNFPVYSLLSIADTLYMGGQFTALAGGAQTYVTSLVRYAPIPDLFTIRDWNPNPYGTAVTCLALSPGSIYVGGQYQRIGIVDRAHIAAFNRTTGEPTKWNPSADGSVSYLAVGTDKVFACGSFTHIGLGIPTRNKLGAFNKADNTAAAWNAGLASTDQVTGMLLHDNTLYVSGVFTQIGGAARSNMAALDATTALATSLNVTINGGSYARDMIYSNDTLFLNNPPGANGVSRGWMVAIRASTGEVLPFDPLVSTQANFIAKSGPRIYVGGYYNSIGGQPVGPPFGTTAQLNAVSSFTGLMEQGWVSAVKANGTKVCANDHAVFFAGGIGNSTSFGLYGMSPVTGALNGFYLPIPHQNGMFACTTGADNRIYYAVVSEVSVGGQQYDLRLATETTANSTLHLRAFLQGPYNTSTGLMNDGLRTLASFPTTEPYTALGYTYVGANGASSLAPSVLSATGNNAIVDWVVVELRDAAAPQTRVITRCALLQRDGDVVALDGTSDLTFNTSGNYFVSIRHRNHLGLMTAAAVPFNGTTTVDFTLPATATYGTSARATVSSVMALWSGDVDLNGTVRYTGSSNDRDPILLRVGSTVPTATENNVYRGEDVNMDGAVKYTGTANDRDPILINIGGSVPTAVRNAQLP